MQILVYAETDEVLEFAKTQIPIVMGRTVSGLKRAKSLYYSFSLCSTPISISLSVMCIRKE